MKMTLEEDENILINKMYQVYCHVLEELKQNEVPPQEWGGTFIENQLSHTSRYCVIFKTPTAPLPTSINEWVTNG